MPSFTMELWRVLELRPDGMTEDEWLGLDKYTLHEESHREELNNKIKNRFMYQEIGRETVSNFRFALKTKMNEIMPLYNELYKTVALEFDPLRTIDIRTTTEGTADQTAEGSSTNTTDTDLNSKGRNMVSDFPQVMLAGNADYVTNGADSNSQTKTETKGKEESESSNNTRSESDSHTVGYQGIPAQLIQAYRAAIINVDLLILSELEPLFMMVWNNGDEYTTTQWRLY